MNKNVLSSLWPFCRLTAVLSVLLVTYTSCDRLNSEYLLPFLEVQSDETLYLPASKAESEVIVSTNVPYWDYLCPDEWLKIERMDDRLVLIPEDNSEVGDRSTQVLISAGSLTKSILVTQEGAGIVFEVPQNELELPFWSKTLVLHIKANSKAWSVKAPEADWIEVSAEPHFERLTIDVTQNSSYEDREASVTLSSLDGKRETVIVVKQKGIDQYMTPFFEWGADIEVIEALEADRGSQLIREPAPSDGFSEDFPYYEFETLSLLFPKIRYQTMNYGTRFVYKCVLVGSGKEAFESEEFEKSIASKGFKRTGTATNANGYLVSYMNKEQKMRALLEVQGNTYEMTITPEDRQPSAMATLPKLYHPFEGIELSSSTAEEVLKVEGQHGFETDTIWNSTILRQLETDALVFHDETPFYSRWYYFSGSDRILEEMRMIFDRLDYGLYPFGGLYLMTNELRALLQSQDYKEIEVLRDVPNSKYVFYNEAKKLALIVEQTTWNGQSVFGYRFIREEL